MLNNLKTWLNQLKTRFLAIVPAYPLAAFGALVLLIVLIWIVTNCQNQPARVVTPIPGTTLSSKPGAGETRDQKSLDSLNALRP